MGMSRWAAKNKNENEKKITEANNVCEVRVGSGVAVSGGVRGCVCVFMCLYVSLGVCVFMCLYVSLCLCAPRCV
jgi:hypothetical protein